MRNFFWILVGAGIALRPHTRTPKPERVPSSLERRLTALSLRTRITLDTLYTLFALVALVALVAL